MRGGIVMAEASGRDLLAEKVKRLERINRLMLLVGIAAAGVYGVGLLAVVRAQKAAVPSKRAVEIAGGGQRTLTHPSLCTFELVLADENARERISMDAGEDGSSQLLFRDRNNKTRIWMGIKPDGAPVVLLLDAQGKTVWEAP
jgi:hypothetical protein